MARIRDYRVIAEPVGPDILGSDVFERFRTEPNTLAIGVVDEDGRPMGLIERHAFTLKMAAEFGRALYARRPVSALMDASPMVFDGAMDAATLFQSLDDSELGGLLGGFIITENGRYSGVGSGVQVLQAASALARRRAVVLPSQQIIRRGVRMTLADRHSGPGTDLRQRRCVVDAESLQCWWQAGARWHRSGQIQQ